MSNKLGLLLLLVASSTLSATPLHDAVLTGNLSTAETLLQEGVDPDLYDDSGLTALHWALRDNRDELVALLIRYKANPNLTTGAARKDGFSPLHYASFEGNENTVTMLINAGGRVNNVNYAGDTPLHLAAEQNQLGVVQILLDAGAVQILNQSGELPQDTTKNETILELLVQRPRSIVHLRFPLFFSYVIPFEGFSAQSIVTNMRLGLATQLSFSIDHVALGVEIGTRFGVVELANANTVRPLIEGYLQGMFRITIPADQIIIDITPLLGIYLNFLNGQPLLAPDVAFRFGIGDRSVVSRFFLEIGYIFPATFLHGADQLSSINSVSSRVWSNALSISTGYSFGF